MKTYLVFFKGTKYKPEKVFSLQKVRRKANLFSGSYLVK